MRAVVSPSPWRLPCRSPPAPSPGAIARLRLLPMVAVALVLIDTLGAHLLGAVAGPPGRDLLLRTVPLVALLGSVLLTSAALARRSPRATS